MLTLVYIKNQFNRPDILLPFLQSNVGNSQVLQIDCITPYKGLEQDLINELCDYLNAIDPQIKVTYEQTLNVTLESDNNHCDIHYIVVQIRVSYK